MNNDYILMSLGTVCPHCDCDGVQSVVYKRIALMKGLKNFFIKHVLNGRFLKPNLHTQICCTACGMSYDDAFFDKYVDRDKENRLTKLLLETDKRTFRHDADPDAVFTEERESKFRCKYLRTKPLDFMEIPVRVKKGDKSYRSTAMGPTYIISDKNEEPKKIFMTKIVREVSARSFKTDKMEDWLMEIYGAWDDYQKPLFVPRSSLVEEEVIDIDF